MLLTDQRTNKDSSRALNRYFPSVALVGARRDPDWGPVPRRIAELDCLVSSRAASTSLAESYVGLPIEIPSYI